MGQRKDKKDDDQEKKMLLQRKSCYLVRITVQKRKDAPALMLHDGTEGPEGGAISTLKTNSVL